MPTIWTVQSANAARGVFVIDRQPKGGHYCNAVSPRGFSQQIVAGGVGQRLDVRRNGTTVLQIGIDLFSNVEPESYHEREDLATTTGHA